VGEPVHPCLRHVHQYAETTHHVAVERRIADGELALVAGCDDQPAEFVRERHQETATDARLDVLLGKSRVGARELLGQRFVVGAHHRLDRKVETLDAEISGDPARVGLRLGRRVRRGHHGARNTLVPECIDRYASSER
jgi:hypothetical protein